MASAGMKVVNPKLIHLLAHLISLPKGVKIIAHKIRARIKIQRAYFFQIL